MSHFFFGGGVGSPGMQLRKGFASFRLVQKRSPCTQPFFSRGAGAATAAHRDPGDGKAAGAGLQRAQYRDMNR